MKTNGRAIKEKIQADGRTLTAWARMYGFCAGTVQQVIMGLYNHETRMAKAILHQLEVDGYLVKCDDQEPVDEFQRPLINVEKTLERARVVNLSMVAQMCGVSRQMVNMLIRGEYGRLMTPKTRKVFDVLRDYNVLVEVDLAA